MTILAFGLGQLPAAYAMMYQDEETVSSLKRLNEKISNKTKISSVVKIIKEENIEELYKNLSINDKARVNADYDGELTHIVAIMASFFNPPPGKTISLEKAVEDAGFDN